MYVTWPELLAFVLVIIGVVDLVRKFYDDKHR